MILTRHIVGFGGDRAKRRPAQDIFAPARFEQVRQVRVTAGKLTQGQSGFDSFEPAAQISSERLRVDLFPFADGAEFGRCGIHAMASGRMGDPVPPRILSGVAVNRNA
jgi:hypothetical protein